ncbi:MAG: O-antigen ligase domain-containing protein, partial [Proteobacteria bacterium]|nr:O-antigen ligase domain-containing protein [Pseudomonadota bacterium]
MTQARTAFRDESGARATLWSGAAVVLAFLFFVVQGAGLGLLLPAGFQALSALSLLLLVLDPDWQSRPFRMLPKELLLGLMLLLLVPAMNVVAGRLPLLDFTSHVYAVVGFAVAHMLTALVCVRGGVVAGERIRIWALLGLLILVGGQVAQLFGWLPGAIDVSGEEPVRLLVRPGGFHNPNATAAIALVLLEVLLSGHGERKPRLLATGWIVTIVVVLLAQSRAVAVFLLVRAAMAVWLASRRQALRILAVASAVILGGLWLDSLVGGEAVRNLGEVFFARFAGDESSQERTTLLRLGFEEFCQSPWFGHGYRHLTFLVGLSTHNEVLENLVNWGFVGSLPTWAGFFLIYGRSRPGLWVAG